MPSDSLTSIRFNPCCNGTVVKPEESLKIKTKLEF